MPYPPAHEPPRRLAARKQGNLFFLDLAGLLAFEAADRLTYLHHAEGTYSVDLSLNALATALGARVLRVHRNWLISPDRVQGLSRLDGDLYLELRAGLRVPVARHRAREIRKRLLQDTLGLADA
jgi:DNA-binding LytR/AlgR family response regulator